MHECFKVSSSGKKSKQLVMIIKKWLLRTTQCDNWRKHIYMPQRPQIKTRSCIKALVKKSAELNQSNIIRLKNHGLLLGIHTLIVLFLSVPFDSVSSTLYALSLLMYILCTVGTFCIVLVQHPVTSPSPLLFIPWLLHNPLKGTFSFMCCQVYGIS